MRLNSQRHCCLNIGKGKVHLDVLCVGHRWWWWEGLGEEGGGGMHGSRQACLLKL